MANSKLSSEAIQRDRRTRFGIVKRLLWQLSEMNRHLYLSDDEFSPRTILAIMRLRIRDAARFTYRNDSRSPVERSTLVCEICIEIISLIEHIIDFEVSKGLPVRTPTFGETVEWIFRRRILSPVFATFGHVAWLICQATLLITPFPARMAYASSFVDTTPDEILVNLGLGDVMCAQRHSPDAHWRKRQSKGESLHEPPMSQSLEPVSEMFDRAEFEICNLVKVGRLSVRWSQNLDDHLLLSQTSYCTTLTLFWPANSLYSQLLSLHRYVIFAFKTVVAYLSSFLTCDICRQEDAAISPSPEEVIKTFRLLFQSTRNGKKVMNMYRGLKAPQFLGASNPKKKRPNVALRWLPRSKTVLQIRDMPQALVKSDSSLHCGNGPFSSDLPTSGSVYFLQFPTFADRLKLLKQHMDAQKPAGIRGLWYDTRNLHAWWTFWAVIFVGVVTIVLAFASFAVAVVQTVVAYRGLQLQAASAASPSSSPSSAS